MFKCSFRLTFTLKYFTLICAVLIAQSALFCGVSKADQLSEHLSKLCKLSEWRGLSALLELSSYDQDNDLKSCQRSLSAPAQIGSLEANHRWVLIDRALSRLDYSYAKQLIETLSPLRDGQIKDALPSEWAEIAPSLSKFGIVSSEHLQEGQTLMITFTLPPLPNGASLGVGYRGEVTVRQGAQLIEHLPEAKSLWIDQAMIELAPSKSTREVSFELASGGQLFARLSPREYSSTLWERSLRRLDQESEQINETELLGFALYAQQIDANEAQRIPLIIEAHERWSRSPSLKLALLFWSLTPPAIRAQAWGDYPLSEIIEHTPQGIHQLDPISQIRYRYLLLNRLTDHLHHGRLHDAALDLHLAEDLPLKSPRILLLKATLFSRLGSVYTALGVLNQALEEFKDSQAIQLAIDQIRTELGARASSDEISLRISKLLLEYQKLHGLNPSALQSLLVLGNQLFKQSDRISSLLDEALSLFTSGSNSYSSWSMMVGSLNQLSQNQSEILLKRAPIRSGELFEQIQKKLSSQAVIPKTGLALGGDLPWLRFSLGQRQTSEDERGAIELYHHIHYHFEDQRLTRITRRVFTTRSEDHLRGLLSHQIQHSPSKQTFRLDHARRLRLKSKRDTQRSTLSDQLEISDYYFVDQPTLRDRISLSQPEERIYYDLFAEKIGFEDIRADDIIDLQWSISERVSDQGFERPHADLHLLSGALPRRCVIVTTGSRVHKELNYTLDLKGYENWPPCVQPALSSEIRLAGEARSHLIVSLKDVPAVVFEPGSLTGTSAIPSLHLSNIQSWSTIATLYQSLLSPLLAPHEAISLVARQWTQSVRPWTRQSEDRPRYEKEVLERLYLKLTEEIRYVGLEFGVHSFIPAPPSVTFERRAGDCKDRAALLILMATSLNVPLRFVMVRTAHAGELDPKGVASLSAFDHAIIYSPTLDRYLDPTVSEYDPWFLPSPDQGAQGLHVEGNISDGATGELISLPMAESETQGIIWMSHQLPEGTRRVTVELRGEEAAQARRIYSSSPHGWQQKIAQRYQHLIPSEFISSLKMSVKRRDPIQLNFSIPNSELGQPLWPPFKLTHVLNLLTSLRTTSLQLPAFHSRRCITPSVLAETLGSETPLQIMQKRILELDSPPKQLKIKIELNRHEAMTCIGLSVASQVIPSTLYPILRQWLIKAEEILNR